MRLTTGDTPETVTARLRSYIADAVQIDVALAPSVVPAARGKLDLAKLRRIEAERDDPDPLDLDPPWMQVPDEDDATEPMERLAYIVDLMAYHTGSPTAAPN